ncbi:hypothetical protein D1AOALGA4SA_10455 [Olavius algarvensis Delta 1 endosymbiont]|nr:hypothetical protein D1AOALGA4SA_10455 [Olavius algarvensis Delta 1 endosymbiont]
MVCRESELSEVKVRAQLPARRAYSQEGGPGFLRRNKLIGPAPISIIVGFRNLQKRR